MRCATLVLGASSIFLSPISLAALGPQEPAGATAKADKPPFKQEELDQMLAPIALHPDDLLSQILMAATYPIEVVQAERWVKANAKLKGDALAKELEKQTWDPSVRSLVNFSQVLTMMSEKLDWTVNLGNAFLGQQKEVMDTVQKLRGKAKEAGNLESTKEQEVATKSEGGKEVIVIEATDPEVIYVPAYNPTVIYGSWWYPSYPPYYWYPPGYIPPAYPAFHFGVGVAVGVAWGYAWGHCGWGHSEVDIDINRNTNINTDIDRGKYAQQLENRGMKDGKGNWQHDPSHRQGAAYRDQTTAKKFGGASAADTARSRDAYRGRTAASQGKVSSGQGNRGGASTSKAAANRTSASSQRANGFDGVSQGGGQARAASNRGRASRSASPSGGGRRSGGGGGRRR